MVNLFESVRSNPGIKKLEIGDFLFAEYTCGVTDEMLGIWAHTDYLVNVVTGKKTWHTPEGIWSANPGETLFFKKGAAVIRQHFEVDLCLLMFFIPDHLIRSTVREIAGSLNASRPRTVPIKSAARVQNDVALSAFLQSMRVYFSGKETPGKWLLRQRLEHSSAHLRHSKMNVTEIALASGFEDVSHFSRVFKKRFSVAPLSYRQAPPRRRVARTVK